MPLTPSNSNPSSVKVPVLSNTIILILPLMLTLGGEMQNILLRFSLVMAKATPTDIVAGKAGGTVIVIRSRDLSIIFSMSVPDLSRLGNVIKNPKIPTKAIAPTNTSESW